MTTNAQNSNTHFQHTIETTASPESIWKIWTDVPNWQQWDSGLKSAILNGNFEVGTKGKLIPDKGPKAKFRITEMEAGKSYTFKTSIPFGGLFVKRTLETKNGKTYFTHEVWFTGLLKGFFGKQLGSNYKNMLPEVMETIKTMAEK